MAKTEKEAAEKQDNEVKVAEDKFRVCLQDKVTGSRRWVEKPKDK